MPSSRNTGRDNAVRIEGMRVAVADTAPMGLAVTANSPMAVISARAAMQILTPRQPIHAPTQAARGTPTSKVSDWPLIAQPSARPC